MREIVVISGKGGTGKTSLSAAFASICPSVVLVDCDVDAADLHLIAAPTVQETHDFFGLPLPHIDPARCIGCGDCQEVCRFGAVEQTGDDYQINPLACERCGICVDFCPAHAIDLVQSPNGTWFISDTRLGPMVHAQLTPGAENSGKLVTLIRREARRLARATGVQTVLVDGPPGIGCPVIASLSGASAAVVVTEPTLAGLHDLERVARVATNFKVPVMVVINKADLNPEFSSRVEEHVRSLGITVLGSIPYDRSVVEAQLAGLSVPEYTHGPVERALRAIWTQLDAALPVSK